MTAESRPARMLFNAAVLRSEGGVTLMLGLLESFLRERPGLRITLIVNPELAGRVDTAFGQRPKLAGRLEVIPFKPKGFFGRFFWEQISLPLMLRGRGFDVLFSFANTGPLFPGCRQVLYMQQAVPYTDYKPSRHKLRWLLYVWAFRVLIALAQWGSDIIVVQTAWLIEPMRRSVLNSIPAGRYRVVPPGLPPTDQTALPEDEREIRLLARLETMKAAGRRLLFYPAFPAPYKHVPYLLEAMRLLGEKTDVPFSLVLTLDEGTPEYFPSKADIFDAFVNTGLGRETVVFAGGLSRRAVSRMYQLSDVLVFPSLVESFGLPLLEAVACGLPVVACETPFAREICAGAALYADPGNPAEFAECLLPLLTQEAERQRRAVLSAERAERFSSWGDETMLDIV